MEFPYSKGNGILGYLYKKYKGNIDQYLNYSADFRSETGNEPRNAFDQNLSTYWMVYNYPPDNNSLTFCLKNYYVKITNYEIWAPDFRSDFGFPTVWGFLGANNIYDDVDNNQIDQDRMVRLSYFSTDYTRGVHQCFKYVNRYWISQGGMRSMVGDIDIFGTLYPFHCPTFRMKIIDFFKPSTLFVWIVI